MERLTSSMGYCDAFCENNKNCCQIYASCINRQAYEKLKEYEDLEEQRKLLKLPCTVGDTVYQHMIVRFNGIKKKPIYEIFKATIFKFSLSSCGLCFCTETADENKYQNEVPLSMFGTTVFLTKPEAEQALKEIVSSDL